MRKQRVRHVRRKARQLRCHTRKLQALVPSSVAVVAGKSEVGIIIYVQVLIGWSDLQYVVRLILGFRIIDDIESPLVFRRVQRIVATQSRDVLLAEGSDYIDELERTGHSAGSPEADEAMVTQCEKGPNNIRLEDPYAEGSH